MTGMIITITEPAETSFKEKASVFDGKAFPIKTEEGVEKKLQELRKEFYNATHHCYAWKLHTGVQKYSDDGEPNGTAGIRILNAIEHFSLTDLLVVVIRYYGGTKLGVGPLGKAYYKSAYDTLEIAGKTKLFEYARIKVAFDFNASSPVYHILSNHNAKIIDTQYTPDPVLTAYIKYDETAAVKEELVSATAGQTEFDADEKVFYI